MTEALLVLDDLCIRTAERTLVDGISLTVRAGAITALVGHSGSGKSLTARAVMGVIDVAPGLVRGTLRYPGLGEADWFDGVRGAGERAQRRLLRRTARFRGGYVTYAPQSASSALNPGRTIGRQLEIAISRRTTRPSNVGKEIQRILDEVGLPSRTASALPTELSGGMAQRAALAIAIAPNPRVMIADEPETGLDPVLRRVVTELMLQVADDHRVALLLITHNMDTVGRIADDVVRIAESTGPEAGRSVVIVEARSVTKTFLQSGTWPWSKGRPVEAVRDVSLTIGPGEIVALVGQSGSGKTTLSRCILGLEAVSGGRILLEGKPWNELPERVRRPLRVRYQYVPQDALSALDPQQTASEHVVESLVVLGGRDRRTARLEAGRMLERLGLGHRGDALPREMSGGEQRRVTLARVFALEPRLIVADEPTSGLDPDRQESVLEALIRNLPPQSACILVTHDVPQARKWCTRALVMLEGRVVEELPLPGGEPRHPYARMLFDPWGEHDLAKSTAF